jgi:hypothetical protein
MPVNLLVMDSGLGLEFCLLGDPLSPFATEGGSTDPLAFHSLCSHCPDFIQSTLSHPLLPESQLNSVAGLSVGSMTCNCFLFSGPQVP